MISKLDLRPTLELLNTDTTTEVELFQNQTLRPILKLQHEIYSSLFAAYATRQKSDYDSLTGAKKRTFIELSLQKDMVLKNTFIGITIGMFTLEELQTYSLESKEYNRRIITMLIERLKSETK